jgi:ribosomal protein S12 methylthiotransferase accessory factor
MLTRASTIPDRGSIGDSSPFAGPDGRGQLAVEVDIDKRGRYSDRACPPEETFARVSPLLRRYGVTRIARQTGLDYVGIPVWSAMRPNSLSLAVNQGKGIGDADAKISAVMEALERAVAGEPEVVSRLASQAEIRAGGSTTDALDGLVAKGHTPITDSDRLAWVEGHDLIEGGPVWVPLDAVMLDRTSETRFWQSSDGLASGNTPAEATFHGLLERIERDADVLWSLAKSTERAQHCVDPAAFRDPVIDMLVAKIGTAGLRLQVFDITSDIGVACFQVLIGPRDIMERRDPLYSEAATGSGCHPDPVRAVIRAITEAAQSRLTLVSGARDDIPDDTYFSPMPKELIEDFDLRPHACQWSLHDRDDRPIAIKLQSVLQALRARKIVSAIAVPLNAHDAAFAVVKVLVPSLENPPGERQKRFGSRALARMMSTK